MKKIILLIAGISLALVIIGLAVGVALPYLGFFPSHLSATVLQSRLVPEKVSRSGVISVALPRTLQANAATQVIFNPAISGDWLKKENGELLSTTDSRSKTEIYYYQPTRALELGSHYAAVVNIGPGQTLREDFLAAPDPEVLAILPSNEEVLPQTKISIVFNRPMIPLSRLDQFVDDSLPVTITPSTPGRFKWISTNTLQFIPKNDLVSSAQYLVAVNSGFKSMDGLVVKAKMAKFSTYHLAYDNSDEASLKPNIVRGYNQPFLIRFNQPVDLEKTKNFITINSEGKNIPFNLAYAKKSVATDTLVDDFQTIALTPVGQDNRWRINQNYVVTVNRAFPKSGGDIILDKKQSFAYQVGGLIKYSQVTSPRTSVTSLDHFDPKGTLVIGFYEDVDLDKSQISGQGISRIVYGEKCDEESRRDCLKVPNQKEIIISFKSSVRSNEKVQISLDRIVSMQEGITISEEKNAVNLVAYGPLTVSKIASGDSLGSFTICSNNPLVGPKDDQGGSEIQITPSFGIDSFNGSYLTNSVALASVCKVGEYLTQVTGYLMANQKYVVTAKIADAFGSQVDVNTSFNTRAVRAEDYQITSHQDNTVTTVPSRTKLTFSANHLPEVLVTVCKLQPTDFYQAQKSRDNVNQTCEARVNRTLPLSMNNPEGRFLTVDIKDYFPLAVGNYLVTVSPTLPIKLEKWQSEARVFLSVTNLIVTEKKINPLDKNEYESLRLTGDQLSRLKNLYWVLDAVTREPVAGAMISLYRQGSVLGTAITDNQGIASLTPVVGSDMTVVTFAQDAVVISENFSALSWASRAANIKHLFLYTDKPIYRPGQEVNLKGYYRLGYDGYYEVPAQQELVLKVYDSANQIIKEENLKTNAFGSVATNLNLNSTVPLGSYRACVEYQCAHFEVLNYSPAAFRIALNSEEDEFTLSEQPKINLKADYYFGVPVSGASVDYYLSSQYYYFDKYTDEYFNFNNLFTDEQENNGKYYYGDRYLHQGKTVLDDNGETVIDTKLASADLDAFTQSKIIILDTTVKNQSGRTIGAQKSFVLHAAPNYLGSKVEPSFAASGVPVALKVKSVDISGTPVSLGGIEASVYRVRWTADQRSSSDKGEYMPWKRTRELIKTESLRTDESGNGTINLVITGEGEYEVDAKTKGSQAVGSRSWFYLYGNGNVNVRSQGDTFLKIKAEKGELQPGDTGRVVMEIPEGRAKALITIERGRVFSYKVIDIVGNLASYEFPVTLEYYPNVHLSVVAYAPGRAVRFGATDFRVSSNQQKLKINLATDKKVYAPGDLVSLSLVATDEMGRPARAEVSVAVVDMSVLALRGNPKKDPIKEFYGNIPLTVATYSNFRNLLKSLNPASDGGGKGGSGNDPNTNKKRGMFKEVALWTPNLITDSAGHANITFKLPDNLTTWQAEAVGMTVDTKVGAGYHEFSTQKLLMVTPLKPRFILPGDQFSLGAQVFNQSSKTLDLEVVLTAPSLKVTEQKSKNLSLKSGESKTVYWKAGVPSVTLAGKVGYSLSVVGGGLTDGVDDELIINPNTLYEVTATAGETDNRITELVYVPDSILPDQGGLTINSSATLAVYLPSAFEYFISNTYESSDHVSSRLQSAVLISQALGVPNLTPQSWPGLKSMITRDLDSLYALQNSDGGFRMWPESTESNYRSTAEAVNVFAVMSQAGYQIKETAWSQATKYLADMYLAPNVKYGDTEILAFLRVLFTQNVYRSNPHFVRDLNRIVDALIDNKKSSSNLLLTASEILHQFRLLPNQMERIDSMIKNRLVIDSRGTFLDVGPNKTDYNDSATRNTARIVSILVTRQENDQIAGLLRWLISSRDKTGAWGSTKNTLAAVKAITDYLKWQPETSGNFVLENRLNDQVVMHFTFEPKSILTQLTKVFPLNELHFGDLNVVSLGKLVSAESGKVYYDLTFKYFIPAQEAMPRDEGFAIKRDFFALADKKNETPISDAKVGEVIREHLEITVPATRRDVAIRDFIPAGLEIVDTSLATEDKTLNAKVDQIWDSKFWPSHREWRDDHAFLYREMVGPGTYEFDYLVRALVPGDYLRLPAQIWEMNNPENFGRSGASRFVVK